MSSVLGFYGGTGSVTGANFLLDTRDLAILVDCGLVQGDRFALELNSLPFVYNPADIDVLFVTHAHADHIGRIPKLVKDGFAGVIYSTEPTKTLANIMLHDALSVMQHEKEKYGHEVIYDAPDIERALSLWNTVSYEEHLTLQNGIEAWYTDAGHILGSGMLHLKRNGRKIVFTGDIGNIPQPLLNKPVIPKDYHYLVMESVYGDRLHEEVKERTSLLRHYIEETRKINGTLLIPAFSLERTQSILLEINDLIEKDGMAPVSVYLDSPLAREVTDLYYTYKQYLKDDIQKQIENGDDIFSFKGLTVIENKQERNKIEQKGPKVIIAGSGMSHGGRIRAYEREYLDDQNTTLLLVGYQSVGSLGRLLQDGAKRVRIDGEDVKVKARIARIRGFSGHADRDQLLNLVAEGGDTAEKIFVAMGEEHAALFLVQRLRDYLGVKAMAPSQDEEIEIDF